jgi:hypothetical protein
MPLRLDLGLLTAAQVLDLNADEHGFVWTRFLDEPIYQKYQKEYWKERSRFKRRAGELGSNVLVRDRTDAGASFFLGNNHPLGSGDCIGTTLPLTDNRPGTRPTTREEWFRTLNSLFWVFAHDAVNEGFLNHAKAASPVSTLHSVVITTAGLSDEFIENKIRLSAINGGGSQGARARGSATYKAPSEWSDGWPPREIGLLDGLDADSCAALLAQGTLSVVEVS